MKSCGLSGRRHGRPSDLANAIATIGENMTLRRAAPVRVDDGVIGYYVHNAVADGLGKIGVIVALESTGDTDELGALGRRSRMHVAAANPQALDAAGLDPAVLEREKDVLAEKNAGKPANVLDKIVESGLKTYYKEVCLLDAARRSTTMPRRVGAGGGGSAKTVGSPGGAQGLRALCARRGHREAGSRISRPKSPPPLVKLRTDLLDHRK